MIKTKEKKNNYERREGRETRRVRNRKKVAVSPVGFVFLQWAQSLQPFTAGFCVGGWSQHWRSMLGSPVRGPGFTPLWGKLHSYVEALARCLWKWCRPLLHPCPFAGLEVVSAHSWLSISFPGSLQFGWMFPSYFLFSAWFCEVVRDKFYSTAICCSSKRTS